MGARPESDLYAPIKEYLEAAGYDVRGEVRDCDLVALRGDEMLIVEMKAAFNLALVLQGIDRQEVSDTVYLAVEAPRGRRTQGRWRAVQRLCRRLGLGLLAVHFTGRRPTVEAVLPAEERGPRRNKKKARRLAQEFGARSGDFNIGGSTRRPIVTAYREAVLTVAHHLSKHGPLPVSQVEAVLDHIKAGAILRRNYYGWFCRVARGTYGLTAAGEEALQTYADVLKG